MGGVGEVVERARRGDAGAWAELHAKHAPRVRHVCARIIGRDYDLAEDLTQETFLQAWRKLHTFRGHSAFSTWLHRIAYNVALQWIRREKRKGRSGQLETSDTPYEGIAVARECDSDIRIDLERAIAALPAGYREETILHAVYGLAHSEIAEMSGRSIGSSKSQWHKAKYKLQAAMA